jgi:hypothetical protein
VILDDAQVERWSRHILLPEVGARGQARLLAARAVVLGEDPAAAHAGTLLERAGVVTAASGAADVLVILGDHEDAARPAVTAHAGAGRPAVLGPASRGVAIVAAMVGRPCPACLDVDVPLAGRPFPDGLAAPGALALGALAATEALRLLLRPPSSGRLTRLDLVSGAGEAHELASNRGCAVCGGTA